jgi:membrane protein implicated in regulation of membrane protease activity
MSSRTLVALIVAAGAVSAFLVYLTGAPWVVFGAMIVFVFLVFMWWTPAPKKKISSHSDRRQATDPAPGGDHPGLSDTGPQKSGKQGKKKRG